MKTFTLLLLWIGIWSCHAQDTSFSEEFFNQSQETFPSLLNEQPSVNTSENRSVLLEESTEQLELEEDNLFSPAIEPEPSTLLFEEEKDEFRSLSELLEPEKAFIFSIDVATPTILVARWQIADGYYLYRDQFKFSLEQGGILAEPQFPKGQIKADIKYGSVEVYEQQLEIKLPITDSQGLKTLVLKTTYQGCAEARLCYPPIEKVNSITLPEVISPTPIPVLESQTEIDFEATETAQETPGFFAHFLQKMSQLLGLSQTSPFLKPEAAFVFSAEFPAESSQIILKWQIAKGYYLYQDKFKVAIQENIPFTPPQFPPALIKKDPQFGEVRVYQQPQLELIVPIQAEHLQALTLQVEYQGCAEAGFCYPPIKKVVHLNQGQQIVSEQDNIAKVLANANLFYTLILFFGFGLLLSLTPCVYPMIPILSGLIVGQGPQVTPYKAFIMSLVYVLAMATTYAIVGVLTALLGENLQAAFQNPWVLVSFAFVFIFLALSMFGFYELQLPNRLQTKLSLMSNSQQSGTLIGVAIMGILSALIVGPCVAPPLVGALVYIGQTGDKLLGGLALFSMSLGMGVPLLLIGISAGHFLPKVGQWMETTKAIFGVLLLAVAIWMLERIISPQITLLLWASLLIVSAVYMGALEPLKNNSTGWYKLWKGIGLILLIYGVLLIIGASSGHVNPLRPLEYFNESESRTKTPEQGQSSDFKRIKGLKELEQELAAAQSQNKQVVLDFYADWCISCKEMEYLTFSDLEVRQLLSHFVLLQADVTLNNEQDKALYKHFGIYGPPVILFFDTNGQELRGYRVVGFISAEDFRQHLRKIIQLRKAIPS